MLAQALFHKLFSAHVAFEGKISLQEATDWGALFLFLRWRQLRLRISLIKDTVPDRSKAGKKVVKMDVGRLAASPTSHQTERHTRHASKPDFTKS
jgi:hypothetical protein